MMPIKYVKEIECPYCGSDDVECDDAEPLEYEDSYTVISEGERYSCAKCGKEFEIRGTYKMTSYVVEDEDGNETDCWLEDE